jgi:hypothetical protein
VFEPHRIGVAARQQRGAALAVGRQGAQRFAGALHEGTQRFDLLILEDLGHDAGEVAAIFQRIRQAASLIGPIGDNSPDPIGTAHQVCRVDVQVPGG